MLNVEEGWCFRVCDGMKGRDKCSWSMMEQRRDRVIIDDFVCGSRSAVGHFIEKV